MSKSTSIAALQSLIRREYLRQGNVIQLIASENLPSPLVHTILQYPLLAFKTAEGEPGSRFHAGCEVVDDVERLAQTSAKQLFRAQYANVQPVSASVANLAAFQALLKAHPQPRVLAMDLSCGGHISHRNFADVYFYGVDRQSLRIDYLSIREQALRIRPTLIIAGSSAYPREIDFLQFRNIADEVGAFLLADIAHVAGLVAAGLHNSPIEHAHVTTASTYKTLRGPRSGVILGGRDSGQLLDGEPLFRLVNRALFPGLQSSPNLSTIAAKAACFIESADVEFASYSQRVVANSNALAAALSEMGVSVVTGGTDTHMLLVDVSTFGLTGVAAEAALTTVGIHVNRNLIPYDKRSSHITSGLRFGTGFATSRGLAISEMKLLGAAVVRLLEATRSPDGQKPIIESAVAKSVAAQIAEIAADHPLPADFALPTIDLQSHANSLPAVQN